jgi:hypothetical protein
MTSQEWIGLARERAYRIVNIDQFCLRGTLAKEIIKFLNEAEIEIEKKLKMEKDRL